MKKVMIALIFLLVIGGVAAMEDSITVKTYPGNFVKLLAWPNDGGRPPTPPLTGNADENGIFEKTFFSLSIPDVKYQVLILRNGEKIIDEKFPNQGIEDPLLIDCSDNIECSISIRNESEIEETVIVEVVNETESTKNETIRNSITPTGNAIFTNEDGSLNTISVVIGILIIIAILVVIIVVLKKRKKKTGDAPIQTRKVIVPRNDDDDNDDELDVVQKKLKEKDDEIKAIKERSMRTQKLEEAKRKLAEEEKELEALKNPTPATPTEADNQSSE